MPSRLLSINHIVLGLFTLAFYGGLVVAADQQTSAVHALAFYGPDCPECGELFRYFLPGLRERYGDRFEVAGIDVGQRQGADVYRAVAGRYGLPAKWVGTPVMITGDKAMVGLAAIAQTLGDRFDEVARSPGAAAWPSVAGLEPLLPSAVAELKARVAKEGVVPVAVPSPASGTRAHSADRDRIANGLAIVVLIAMAVVLVHSLVRVWRGGRPLRSAPVWLLPIVLVVGLGVSAYTAYTALADVAPICGPIGSCESVQHSEYAKIFGVPMGVLGLVGYGAILVTWLIGRLLSPQGGGWRWLPWVVALFGVLFSLRLTALEPFVIGATCLWCLGSAVSITVTLWLLSAETLPRGESGPEARWPSGS